MILIAKYFLFFCNHIIFKKLQEVRELESLKLKYTRVASDIKFIKMCKKKELFPTL